MSVPFATADKTATDLIYARGVLADCCHHTDAAVIAACDTILLLDHDGDDAHRARTLRDTLERTSA
tara:strand:+ start:54597 stop:54794 length:198 start_codon:yes stop_codon:yes gene_type:complete